MKHLIVSVLMTLIPFAFTSCESCVRKTTEKVTQLGLSALDTASDVIAEQGEKTGEKAVGAIGSVTKGVGKGLEKFIEDYAAEKEVDSDHTFIKFTETVDMDKIAGNMNEIPYSASFPTNSSLEYLGEFKEDDIAAMAAILVIEDEGNYDCSFQLLDNKNNVLLEKSVALCKVANEGNYANIAIALTPSETEKIKSIKKAKVSLAKQKS